LFAHLGTKVTIVGRLAPRAEPELASRLRRLFLDDGITVVHDRAATIEPDGNGVVVVTAKKQRVSGERVLVATGRSPRTAELNLAAAGVKTDERGFIVVDDEQRAGNPTVFAAGDVTSATQFVYVAAMSGKVAANNALGARERVDYTGLPSVIFTQPHSPPRD
jgi:mercuric reductase